MSPEEQLTFTVVRPPVRIPLSIREKPVAVLSECKKAAIRARVELGWWVEFRTTAMACLSADCLPEEAALFMRVVEERFSVSS
jgi:hypothetical protein